MGTSQESTQQLQHRRRPHFTDEEIFGIIFVVAERKSLMLGKFNRFIHWFIHLPYNDAILHGAIATSWLPYLVLMKTRNDQKLFI